MVSRKFYFSVVVMVIFALASAKHAVRVNSVNPIRVLLVSGMNNHDWQRELTLPLYHHFVMEYWVYISMPEWGEGRCLSLGFHDGAYLSERGVEYSSPPPLEIRIIR
jgi:hypothetical protein